MASRERLGGRRRFAYRETVYRARDAFEIDEIEGYDVTRKRVFFDDVVLVTRHRFTPWGNAIGLMVLAGMLGLLALALTAASVNVAIGVTLLGVLPSIAALVAVLVIGGHAVTIQGKRTQARLDFVLRPGRADEVFALACRLTRERQQRLAREAAARQRAAAHLPAPPVAPVA
jgi:hypothetical protein